MHVNNLPEEVLSQILALAAKANEAEGPTYSYGIAEVASYLQTYPPKPVKYVRGPIAPQELRWHSSSGVRQTCSKWHEWALEYALEHLMVQMWRGDARWMELPRHVRQYSAYEIMGRPLGKFTWSPGFTGLIKTDSLLTSFPTIGATIRRLWFNGLHLAKTDKHILSIISNCPQLRILSAPWTILRRGTTEDWVQLLKANTPNSTPLHSLELQSVCLRAYKAEEIEEQSFDVSPLDDPRIDFSALKRLKIFGNTLHKPVCDEDLQLIARTATSLESLDITNNSTTTVAGMLALVYASRSTLQVLEHSPRSDDGFLHPFLGALLDDQHICELLIGLPRMRDLSISVPHACERLFSNADVDWMGECQVRANDLCGCDKNKEGAAVRADALRKILSAGRKLMAERARMHRELRIEFFFNHCIFDLGKGLVHGDFVVAEVRSHGQWPRTRQQSTKGPFGTTGTYGKTDGPWDAMHEDEYLRAVENGWILQ